MPFLITKPLQSLISTLNYCFPIRQTPSHSSCHFKFLSADAPRLTVRRLACHPGEAKSTPTSGAKSSPFGSTDILNHMYIIVHQNEPQRLRSETRTQEQLTHKEGIRDRKRIASRTGERRKPKMLHNLVTHEQQSFTWKKPKSFPAQTNTYKMLHLGFRILWTELPKLHKLWVTKSARREFRLYAVRNQEITKHSA